MPIILFQSSRVKPSSSSNVNHSSNVGHLHTVSHSRSDGMIHSATGGGNTTDFSEMSTATNSRPMSEDSSIWDDVDTVRRRHNKTQVKNNLV